MKLREKIITFNVHQLALPIIKHFVKASRIPYTMDELQHLEVSSLGNQLHTFLLKYQIQLLPHFETHDIKHVLLNYGITDRDEGCMQFFYLGNKHYSIATLLTVVTSTLMMPEHWSAFKKAYQRGKKAKPIGKLPLENLLLHDVAELRETYHIHENN